MEAVRPHVAAAASLFLSAYPGSSPSRVKQALEAHARTDAFTGAVPNPTWGYGKLDIYSTFDHQGPTVALTGPAGGEAWAEGSVQNVTWSASDFSGVTAVDLALSTDGGATYPTPIATGIANTGSYGWNVPVGATTTARVRVTAKDPWGNLASAFSATNFSITAVDNVPPTIVLNPPGTLEAGVPANVVFTANDNLAVTGVDLSTRATTERTGRRSRPASAARRTCGRCPAQSWRRRAARHRLRRGEQLRDGRGRAVLDRRHDAAHGHTRRPERRRGRRRATRG
jgi:hypothetical protein